MAIPEWDDDLGDYKPDWVGVIEFHLDAGETTFVDDVLAEHGHMIRGCDGRSRRCVPSTCAQSRAQ